MPNNKAKIIASILVVAIVSIAAGLLEKSGKFSNLFGTTKTDESTAAAAPTYEPCVFSTSALAPDRSRIVFKEIAWMGDKDSPNNEWMSIQKLATGPLGVSGYQILNEKERIKIIIKSNTVLTDEKPTLVLARKQNITGVTADAIYTGALANSGEGLRLFDNKCNFLDEVLAHPDWPGGSNETKQTLKRDLSDLTWIGFKVAAETAKKKPASIAAIVKTVPPSVCPQTNLAAPSHSVLINEVAWEGISKSNATKEWIELKNAEDSDVLLEGWQLLNKSGSIKIFFGNEDSIAAEDFYLLERGLSDFIPGQKADKFFTGSIGNSDESLRLFDADCQLVDEVVADSGKSKAWPAGTTAPDYRTAQRASDFSWHTYSGQGINAIFGTPHLANTN